MLTKKALTIITRYDTLRMYQDGTKQEQHLTVGGYIS